MLNTGIQLLAVGSVWEHFLHLAAHYIHQLADLTITCLHRQVNLLLHLAQKV